MVKALLVDCDGVVLKPRDKYFTDRLREDGYNLPKESEADFFKNVYPDVRIGKRDLKEEVGKYLADWNWSKSVDELLQYWFSHENRLNKEVVGKIQELRRRGLKAYLASDHSKYRADDLWDNVALKQYFDGHFFSCDLGTTKNKAEFYTKALDELGLEPEEVVFLDDEEGNVEAATQLGVNAHLYESIEQLEL